MLEKWKRSSVKTPISDENKRSLLNGSILRFNRKLRRLPCRDLRCGDQIAERTETALESQAGFLDALRVESHAGELDEGSSMCAGKIDRTDIVALNDVPAKLQMVRRQ